MNIFVLDENPTVAGMSLCDKHIVKMVIESAQMLCTALYGQERVKKTSRGCVVTQRQWLWNTHRDTNEIISRKESSML